MNQHDQVVSDTVAWLERAVIGLNLCPFAKSVHVKGQVHYAVSQATTPQVFYQDLIQELNSLVALDSKARDTTLLIAPHCLDDFLDFNDFLDDADQALVDMNLDGVFQIASLHPRYQFAGTKQDDVTNFTNRAPYPTLHLLREDSIDRAVAAFPNPESIFEINMHTMERLGPKGWAALNVGAHAGGSGTVASSDDDQQNH
jgi:hypothetical protein